MDELLPLSTVIISDTTTSLGNKFQKTSTLCVKKKKLYPQIPFKVLLLTLNLCLHYFWNNLQNYRVIFERICMKTAAHFTIIYFLVSDGLI